MKREWLTVEGYRDSEHVMDEPGELATVSVMHEGMPCSYIRMMVSSMR